MALSPRKQALRRITVWTGILSTVAGVAIYLQVSGFAGAVEQVAASVAPADPGAAFTDSGGGGQVPTPAQSNPQPGYGQPIAVSGGS